MKKPKIKKYPGYWLVYTDKKRAFKCYSIETARFYHQFLMGLA